MGFKKKFNKLVYGVDADKVTLKVKRARSKAIEEKLIAEKAWEKGKQNPDIPAEHVAAKPVAASLDRVVQGKDGNPVYYYKDSMKPFYKPRKDSM